MPRIEPVTPTTRLPSGPRTSPNGTGRLTIEMGDIPDPFDPEQTLAKRKSYYNIGLYGREGTGKTAQACMLSIMVPIVVINADTNTVKLAALKEHGIDPDRVNLWPPEGTEAQYLTSHNAMMALQWKLRERAKKDPGSFGIVFDGSGKVARAFCAEARDEAIARELEKDPRDQKQDRLDPEKIQWDDWRVGTERFMQLIDLFCTMPVHFVVTVGEREDPNEFDEPEYGPGYSPSMQGQFLHAVDVIVRTRCIPLQIGDNAYTDTKYVFIGQVWPSGNDRVKDSFHSFPPTVVNPNPLRLLAYISGDLTRETDEQQKEWRALDAKHREWKATQPSKRKAPKAAQQ